MDRIRFIITEILEMGEVPGVGDTRIRELEQTLAKIPKLLENGEADRLYELIKQTTEDLR